MHFQFKQNLASSIQVFNQIVHINSFVRLLPEVLKLQLFHIFRLLLLLPHLLLGMGIFFISGFGLALWSFEAGLKP